MDRLILLLVLTLHFSWAHADNSISSSLNITSIDRDRYLGKNIQLLGALKLDSITANGDKLMEFSGLGWDKDEKLLYALSDRGFIVHLQPVFRKGELIDLELVAYYPLLDKDHKPLRYKHADSEGLELVAADNGISGDTELIVSFERIPRLVRYDTNGNLIDTISISTTLADISQYQGENKSLEAVTAHPQHGLLLGTEKPLPATGQNIFAVNGNKGWIFTPSNPKHGSLVGMTSLAHGIVIALERSFPGIFAGVTSSLHMLQFHDNSIKQQLLLTLKPADGLFNDNFEGLAWHRSNRFFMISDDNDNVLQRNLLLYFAIPDLDARLGELQKTGQ
ncbi:MAG: esterase-like activity of phytase family protein [Gammaproteobacteria bacterium]